MNQHVIVTLTLNPSLDRTIEVDRLVQGAVIRATSVRLDPGGKGVNVSRALLANQVPSVAVVTVGGADGDQLVHLLEADGIPLGAVPVTGRTRSNVTIVEPDGMVTKLNEPGEPLSREELDAVADRVLAEIEGASWVVTCGSVPPGVPTGIYARLCEFFTASGVRVAVDTSGPALLEAVEAGPCLVKPNREELAEAVGRPVDSVGDVIEAAEELRDRGAGTVLASLGADGAVLVEEEGVTIGEAPVAVPRSTVGAGDALLAGFLAAGARGAPALAEGLAWGAAAVSLPASRMPRPEDIRRDIVRIHTRPDLGRSLIA
ncbi:1-phosphofructokinase [Actinoallomurus rhizosphaericola]|uniref:1-phosphofructokinase n=1 Tax=Actinoallomurus rhizosphaericola TaxID=2952536 RepID=UPI002092F8E4|nr:1-phosphofructokinase [Actinoallomurus rhizosphaericola]MCO5999970.1 1-phosphofructokinase [Actinoallomurus rhizosphaericola]